MQFDIINPSDPYTMTACDLEVAAVAVCLLGGGKYALRGLEPDAGADVPLLMFPPVADQWFMKTFGDDFETVGMRCVEDRTCALVAALESVTLGRAERSSLNDIAARGKALAGLVRAASSAKAEASPR